MILQKLLVPARRLVFNVIGQKATSFGRKERAILSTGLLFADMSSQKDHRGLKWNANAYLVHRYFVLVMTFSGIIGSVLDVGSLHTTILCQVCLFSTRCSGPERSTTPEAVQSGFFIKAAI